MIKVAAQKTIEGHLSEGLFEVSKKSAPFHKGTSVKPSSGSRPLRSTCRISSRSSSEANSSCKSRRPKAASISARAAVNSFLNAAFEVNREAFVQPEVAPGRVRDEVAGPRVGQLVRDE